MVTIARVILLIIGVQFYLVCMLFFNEFFKKIQTYFSAPAHPINLALFRILIFACLLESSFSYKPYLFASLPHDLMYPPTGLINISHFLPINNQIIYVSGIILAASALMATIGLWTRPAAWIATLTSIYYLGIPQLYGKVNHDHFIIWFAAVLAASPCADVLSMDASLKRTKSIALPSNAYGFPIRIIFILFGIIFFFPGFWKLYYGGLDWFLSDNLIHHMHAKWFQLNGWLPFFRIDNHPLLCRFTAALVIIFELSFIILIFSEKLRYLAVWGGLIFHTAVELFMNIGFFPLTWCYMIFFRWDKIFDKFLRNKTPISTQEENNTTSTNLFKKQQPLIIVAVILIAGNVYCGIKSIDSWPFSIFPTFANIMPASEETALNIDLIDKNGRTVRLDNKKPSKILRSSNYWGLIKRILEEADPAVRKNKLLALLKWLGQYDQSVKNADYIKAYRNVYSTKPEDFGKPPLRQELFLSMSLK